MLYCQWMCWQILCCVMRNCAKCSPNFGRRSRVTCLLPFWSINSADKIIYHMKNGLSTRRCECGRRRERSRWRLDAATHKECGFETFTNENEIINAATIRYFGDVFSFIFHAYFILPIVFHFDSMLPFDCLIDGKVGRCCRTVLVRVFVLCSST